MSFLRRVSRLFFGKYGQPKIDNDLIERFYNVDEEYQRLFLGAWGVNSIKQLKEMGQQTNQ